MKRTHSIALSVLAAALAFTAVPAAQAQSAASADASAPKETLRKEIYKPYAAAQELFSQKKFPEAMAALAETDAIADKTPYEVFIITSVRAALAQSMNDTDLIIKYFEALINTGRMPAPEQKKLILQLGVRYYLKKDYAKAIQYYERAIKEGEADDAVRQSLLRAYYLNNDFPRVIAYARELVTMDEKAGKKPNQDVMQLWGGSTQQIKDKVGYVEVLEKFVVHYPKKEYWIDLLHRVETKPGFDVRLVLDLYRLQQATGSLSTATEYVDMAQLAVQAGYPAEAKKILDEGYGLGLMTGNPTDVKAMQKLRDQVNKSAADDLKTLNSSEAAAEKPGKDGTALLNIGYALVQIGQYDKGLAMMERGIARGLAKRPEDGKLRLGVAQVLAGRKADAIKTFGTVGGTDGTADIARYWILHLQQQ